ncbi:DUF5995 family protein [Segetibacter aerophilus]|uniref:Uncharacterized protein n=1 Tax=Segetibacter aerophilus TaxID=670293 RepID=A0A512BH09_9BACT|nr:DUF5995 family protein [Segetibacter aerophilus]GEO11256.1 hypothetical protein SAE01_37520 [Segetibacter aerophilus]
MLQANTVDEVLRHLDNIIDWSKERQSRIGYFAILYRKMTAAVRDGIQNNSFTGSERMARLDVIFANRYLQAWDAYVNKKPCPNAWCAAFDASEKNGLIVLQHLLLGINTHINLDLAIAAADCCPKDEIYDLKSDFEKINSVIANLTQSVQDTLAQIWLPMRIINRISDKQQDAVINFSINTARKVSWKNAVTLAGYNENTRKSHIEKMDNDVVWIADRIKNPGFLLSCALAIIRIRETKSVPAVIDILLK